MREREAGQILPLVALLMVVAGGGAMLLGRLGGAAVARARAQTAADAAALAGALDGRDAAAALARGNGGRLVAFEARGGQAFVRVSLGPAVASAQARRGSGPARSGGGDMARAARAHPGLAPALQLALARAATLLGRTVPITSGYRSSAAQARLWEHRAENPYPVAPPGTSAHERGIAVDVPLAIVPGLARVAAQVGLCHPYPVADPVHFELCQ